MKTKEEIKKWLLKNCVNHNGDLDLGELDFSDFEGTIYTYYMKVKNNLWQDYQTVGGDLFQDGQTVDGDLLQDGQKVQGNLFSQKLENDEVWEDKDYCMMKVKKLKEITTDELAKMGYKIKEKQ